MLRQTKKPSSFAVKVPERSNHLFLLSIWWTRYSDICTIIELKELNWLCKHMKNVRSSQPCISMNFVLNSAKHKFLSHVSIVKQIKRLKSLQKAEAYLKPKRASVMQLFYEYIQRLTIFTVSAPSQTFNWVIYRPTKILKFSKWT